MANTVTRRDFVGRSLATAAAGSQIVAPAPAKAFVPGLLARSLSGFLSRSILPNSARVAQSGVSAATQRHAAAGAQLLAQRSAAPRASLWGTYKRGFVGGMGHEMGSAAGRAALEGLRRGWGAVRGYGRPTPKATEDDSVYATFPNHESDRVPMIGCPEISILEFLVSFAVRTYSGRGIGIDEHAITGMLFPLFGVELPYYDDIWNSRTPTVYGSGSFIIRFSTANTGTIRARCHCTIWRNQHYGPHSSVPFTQRPPEYEEPIPLPRQFHSF